MQFGEVDLSLGKILFCRRLEILICLEFVGLDAEAVSEHDAKAIMRFAIALRVS